MTIRVLLHPVTAAFALLVGSVAGHASGVALLLVAGAAAGFANSGST